MAGRGDAMETRERKRGPLRSLDRGEIQKFHAGDERLFRHLVEELSPRLLAVTRSFSRDLDEAHDLLQETWQRAYVKRKSFRGDGSLFAWLYAVCRNVCLADLGRRRARGRLSEEFDPLEATAPSNPAMTAERGQLSRFVHRAVMDLPERERAVVILRLLEGLTTRETAAALGCAEGTVKAALHHALKKLEATMEAWVR